MEEKEILESVDENIKKEESLIGQQNEDIEDTLEEPKITKSKSNKKTRKANKESKDQDSKKAFEDSKELKVGDCVRISAHVGAWSNGTPLTNSLRFASLYVNKINGNFAELKDNSGTILGTIKKSYLAKIKSK